MINDQKGSTDWLFTHLPASADNVKFFDIIGNNSKTHLLYYPNYVSLKFQPRYSLLGGWKTNYILQYQVPAYNYLYSTSEDNFALKIRPFDHVLNDKIIEKVNIKIILPEGAKIKQISKVQSLILGEQEVSFLGGLSFTGRPTVVFNGTNLLEHHISDVVIQYYYYSGYLFKSPLIIICYLQAMFFVFLFGKHLV